MNVQGLSDEEFARRGNEIFERAIRPELDPKVRPRAFVAIDIETGDYEVNERELEAIHRLTDRRPEAKGRVLLRRIGSSHAYHMGAGFRDSLET